ncbi:MAG: type I restriction endonuclease subunit R [Methanosarcinales archaeon]|nr:type I restriction endonuclease subunit R [Methanosarcinales archaeon]
MTNPYDYNEQNISQKPAMEVLHNLGYEIIAPKDAEILRGNLYNVLLTPILKKQLEELNSFEYKGEALRFSNKNIEQAIKDIDESLTDGLVKTNEKIYDSLMLGRSYEETLSDGAKRSFTLKFIDWGHPENNVFHVVEEFSVERENAKEHARPDIVLFVNGIPLAVIECKRSSISIKQGISQMIRNQGRDYIPQLFKFIQIVMATNKNETKYATTSTPAKFWSIWKEEDEKWHQNILSDVVKDRKITVQDENIVSLLHPERLLDITKYFIVYDKDMKKIARYQQFFAVKEIIKTINTNDEEGNRQSGVIWHTQGSGKSITMVMLAKYILSELPVERPRVVVVTDRKNLDKQIRDTFNHTRLKARRATSGNNLIRLIADNNADIITTLVHKFDTASKKTKAATSRDIFVLVDESHRTQYGELNIKMKNVFPNACYLGFTGTPLMKKEKNTMIRFGKLIHSYTIVDGVRDKTILPLLYEGKMVEQTVNQKAIDHRLDMITRNLNDKQKEEVKQKWSRFEKIASSDQRIKLVAFDIDQHYVDNYKTKNANFKAMLATSSKIEAIRYLEAFEELNDINCRVVISQSDDQDGYEAVDQKSKDCVKIFWDKMMERYGDADKYVDTIKDEYVNGDEIDFLIVVDMLLTGFNAPRATVLYVDKPMKEHTLLQAIARVNRLYEGKDFGFIVDYRGLLENLDEALDMYSGAGFENFDPEDLKGSLYDVISIIGSLRQYYTDLINIFIPVKNKKDVEEYEVLLANDEIRDDFYNVLSHFGRFLSIALESEQVYNALSKDELNSYKKDLKFYQELRKTVKLRYSDSIDHKEYEAHMQKLMDNYISAEEIIRITNPVDILDKTKFETELERLGSKRAKADAIRTRMSKSISEKWGENPAFYKKFSQRIEEVIQAYREARISEGEYLDKMKGILEDYRKGDSGITYPSSIKNNPHAQAFYGVITDQVNEINEDRDLYEPIADLSLEVKSIIDKHVKVDFRDNTDIHNRIAQEIDDLLFDFKKENDLELPIEQIDKIIETIKSISVKRY